MLHFISKPKITQYIRLHTRFAQGTVACRVGSQTAVAPDAEAVGPVRAGLPPHAAVEGGGGRGGNQGSKCKYLDGIRYL